MTATATEPRPGSRAARMALPLALERPQGHRHRVRRLPAPGRLRRTDLDTGQTEVIDLPCGATREDKCAACAKKSRRLRQAQIREGWHRDDEPAPAPEPATEAQKSLILLRGTPGVRPRRGDPRRPVGPGRRPRRGDPRGRGGDRGRRAAGAGRPTARDGDEDSRRRHRPACKRSTRRRQDAPDLPRRKVEPRTVGRIYTAPDGTDLPAVDVADPHPRLATARSARTAPPVNPDRYDYRRAAWDASHFPRLLDRFWQNLRRCDGWNVQYAGCVEPQRRLAPHAHFAIRGTIPRDILRTGRGGHLPPGVVAGGRRPAVHLRPAPGLGRDATAWVDPDTREPLTTWDGSARRHRRRPGRGTGARRPLRRRRSTPRRHARHQGRRTHHPATSRSTSPSTPATATRLTTDRQRDTPRPALAPTPASPPARTGARTGCSTASSRRRRTRKLKPGRCKGKVHQRDHPRHSAAGASSSPATGPARPSPTTSTTPGPGCGAARRQRRARPG